MDVRNLHLFCLQQKLFTWPRKIFLYVVFQSNTSLPSQGHRKDKEFESLIGMRLLERGGAVPVLWCLQGWPSLVQVLFLSKPWQPRGCGRAAGLPGLKAALIGHARVCRLCRLWSANWFWLNQLYSERGVTPSTIVPHHSELWIYPQFGCSDGSNAKICISKSNKSNLYWFFFFLLTCCVCVNHWILPTSLLCLGACIGQWQLH